MTDLEWFPLYVNRFLNSRRLRRFDAAKIGIYTLLICEQWEGGPIPNDDTHLAFLGRCEPSDAKAVLEVCFELTPAGWVCPEVEQIRAEQEEKRNKYVEAGRKGGKAKAKNRASDALAGKPSIPLLIEESRIEKSKRKGEKKKKKNPPKAPPYETEFLYWWKTYPLKIGKRAALKAYQARRREGTASAQLIDGMDRYLKWAEATGTKLKHPSTFLGPDLWWKEPWTIPEAATTAEKGNGQGEPILEPKFRKPFEPVIQERKRKAKPVDPATGADLAKTIPAVTNPAEEAAKIQAEREKLEALMGGAK